MMRGRSALGVVKKCVRLPGERRERRRWTEKWTLDHSRLRFLSRNVIVLEKSRIDNLRTQLCF
jgi:hypothetical protein